MGGATLRMRLEGGGDGLYLCLLLDEDGGDPSKGGYRLVGLLKSVLKVAGGGGAIPKNLI